MRGFCSWAHDLTDSTGDLKGTATPGAILKLIPEGKEHQLLQLGVLLNNQVPSMQRPTFSARRCCHLNLRYEYRYKQQGCCKAASSAISIFLLPLVQLPSTVVTATAHAETQAQNRHEQYKHNSQSCTDDETNLIVDYLFQKENIDRFIVIEVTSKITEHLNLPLS